jgi:hypothetical protein
MELHLKHAVVSELECCSAMAHAVFADEEWPRLRMV